LDGTPPKKDGKNVYAIRLGKILKIKRWKK
jgi:hypothetical protein